MFCILLAYSYLCTLMRYADLILPVPLLGMFTYAVQEIQPEEGISQAAQYYNEDIRKIELQIAQSRRKKKGEDVKPEDGEQDDSSEVTPVKPE